MHSMLSIDLIDVIMSKILIIFWMQRLSVWKYIIFSA
jgi:hypothetical protein